MTITGHNTTISVAIYSSKWMRTRSKQPRWVKVETVTAWIEQPGVNTKLWSEKQ